MGSDRILTPEDSKAEWQSYPYETQRLYDSHEAVRAERDEACARVALLEAEVAYLRPFESRGDVTIYRAEYDSLRALAERGAELEAEVERLTAPRGSRHWTREVDGLRCSVHGPYPENRLPACPACCDEQIAEINHLAEVVVREGKP